MVTATQLSSQVLPLVMAYCWTVCVLQQYVAELASTLPSYAASLQQYNALCLRIVLLQHCCCCAGGGA